MLIQHHVKYKEIHGKDEVVMMEWGEHRALHRRLRNEGKCTIPREELHKISTAAHHRTEKSKLTHAAYKKTDKCKLAQAAYAKTEKYKLKQAAYEKKTTRHIDFSDKVDDGIYLRDRLRFNSNSGSVSISSYIHHPKRDIVFIDI